MSDTARRREVSFRRAVATRPRRLERSRQPAANLAQRSDDRREVSVQQRNAAYGGMVKSDVKYRFSIDMASLKGE